MVNLFTVEKIFDKNVILTYFTYFLGCPPWLSIDLWDANDTNVGNPWLKSACARVFCIKDSGTESANIEYVYTINACSESDYIRKVCIEDAYNVDNCIGGTNVNVIYNSAHKLSKSFIWYLKLLVELTSEILISFYSRL